MSRIFWDTNIYIYLYEDSGAFSKKAAALRSRMFERGDQLLTSALTMGEILVKPMEEGDLELCSALRTSNRGDVTVDPFRHSCRQRSTPLFGGTAPFVHPMGFNSLVQHPLGQTYLLRTTTDCKASMIPGIQFIDFPSLTGTAVRVHMEGLRMEAFLHAPGTGSLFRERGGRLGRQQAQRFLVASLCQIVLSSV